MKIYEVIKQYFDELMAIKSIGIIYNMNIISYTDDNGLLVTIQFSNTEDLYNVVKNISLCHNLMKYNTVEVQIVDHNDTLLILHAKAVA